MSASPRLGKHSAEREISFRRFLFGSFFFCAFFVKRKSGMDFDFLLCLLAILRLYLVGELTHMRSMCVGVAETGYGLLPP